MSMIDQILLIEEELQKLRNQGNEDIAQMHSDFKRKKQQIQDVFEQTLVEQKSVLEKEMLASIDQYKRMLKESRCDIKNVLEKRFSEKYNDVIQLVCSVFWEG